MGREDYIVRHIEMVGRFIAQMLKARGAGREDQAIQLGIQAVEKLFGMGMGELSAYSMDAQFARLAASYSANEGRERQFAYALLLKELGVSYRGGSSPEIADVLFKGALWICLRLMTDGEGPQDGDVVQLAREMLASLPPDTIDAPLEEALAMASARPEL